MQAEVRHFEGSGDLCVGDFDREGGLLLEVCCVKAKAVASAAIGCLNLFSCYYIDDFVGSSKTHHCENCTVVPRLIVRAHHLGFNTLALRPVIFIHALPFLE